MTKHAKISLRKLKLNWRHQHFVLVRKFRWTILHIQKLSGKPFIRLNKISTKLWGISTRLGERLQLKLKNGGLYNLSIEDFVPFSLTSCLQFSWQYWRHGFSWIVTCFFSLWPGQVTFNQNYFGSSRPKGYIIAPPPPPPSTISIFVC